MTYGDPEWWSQVDFELTWLGGGQMHDGFAKLMSILYPPPGGKVLFANGFRCGWMKAALMHGFNQHRERECGHRRAH